MRRQGLLVSALALTTGIGLREAALSPGAPPPPAASFTRDVVPFLAKHCYACHGNGKKRGGLSLDRFQDEQAVQKDRKVWDNVLEMVRTGEMPPPERKRPPAKEIEAALGSLDAVLAKLDCTGPRRPGRVTARRLNRTEYNNTIRELVGIDFKPAADFPADDSGYGFDNIGDVLSLSPLLLEKYLAAAEAVLDRAIVIADPPRPAKTRLSNIQATRGAGDTRRGLGTTLHSRGQAFGSSYFDEGDYTIRVEAYGQQAGDEPVRAALRVGFTTVKEFEVKADRSTPATLEAKVRLKAGTARIAVAFLNPSPNATPSPRGGKGQGEGGAAEPDKQQRRLIIRSIVVDGPYNPPPVALPETHKRIMAHRPDLPPRQAAREILTRFATRAFRRPVQPAEVERLLGLYDKAEKEGERFENRVRLALCGVLVSPHFLFRIELDPPDARPGTAYPVNEYELASRLSYFLWSSMPDDELLGLAARGRLRQNLEAQVRRMVNDPKSAAFVQNFAGQWLTLRNLAAVTPDRKRFPDFDEELRSAMHRETEMFFEAILREDGSILDFLDADFSFVNERLARHYGIAGVKGKEFRRVRRGEVTSPLPANRGGILTQASILTLTSNPTRTSPVKRGKWVLDQLLNTPPPPPPPDVPELTEEKQLTGSLRKVMEMHRENALCASCHQRMDPIGFAFENYDAVGAWRDRDGKFAIDPSGVLPDGKSFRGPAELKAVLRGKKDLFSRCLTEKLLTYGLGRGLEYYDKCAVDKITAALEKNDYRFLTLLAEVVKSEPFQMRTAQGGKKR
jgi:hypothetical protein